MLYEGAEYVLYESFWYEPFKVTIISGILDT